MKDCMSIQQASVLWNIAPTRLALLCREGRIPGASKKGRTWSIPSDAVRPTDGRIRTGKYRQTESTATKLPLPVGISDFRKAASEYYYVDKTLLIRDILDDAAAVSLFTRPRRFGKTLNMDMLRIFFEKTEEDTSVFFRGRKLWSCGKKYRDHQGKYPVIYLTFKDVKCRNWPETYDLLSKLIRLEFMRHPELADRASNPNADYYQRIIDGTASENDNRLSLMMLSRMLHDAFHAEPIIIIDEYDTPIQQGHDCGFYEDVILFTRGLFSGAFKDNPHLKFGFLTGILRVAKESIFSGLNNLKVNSILDEQYNEYFGFTPEEVREMADYYGVPDKYEEICAWYDGYRFGSSDIFNPWSVISYFGNNCTPGAFWVSTGSNEVIREVLSEADSDTCEQLQTLLQGKSITAVIDTGVIYPQIKSDPSSVYSFLLVSGYLKGTKAGITSSGEDLCEVAIPNREISFVYNKEILSTMNHIVPKASADSIQAALLRGDAAALKELLEKLLIGSVSFYDTGKELFYHGLMLGLCAVMGDRYRVTSNREAGEGRYDIQLKPMDKTCPGFLIELKAANALKGDELRTLAQAALNQIEEKNYASEMAADGIGTIFRYGIAFSGKRAEVARAN